MLFSFFYECALVLLALIAAPKILYQRLFKGKYYESILQKFGRDFPEIKTANRYVIWIHAVSVGETRAVIPLVRILKKQYNNPLIIISSTTETGHAEAQKSIPFADYHVYLPFDFGFIIKPIIKKISPNLVIITETDFWYNFLKAAKDQGATTVLVNGKLSDRSMRRFKLMSFFSKRLFSLFDILCIQNAPYLKRFAAIGVSEDKMRVTGNLKFDDEYPRIPPDELKAWRKELGIDCGDRVIVVGSTHQGEEMQILSALKEVGGSVPNLKIVLVPRHPERFDDVAGLLKRTNTPYVRLSKLYKKKGDEKVILIDAMGLLRKCYQFADVAIVGGSYNPNVGGHNIVEPCWYGVPVLFGPHMHSQVELVDLVRQYQAGCQVPIQKLATTLIDLLSSDEKHKELGVAGLLLAEKSQGASGRTFDALPSYVGSALRT